MEELGLPSKRGQHVGCFFFLCYRILEGPLWAEEVNPQFALCLSLCIEKQCLLEDSLMCREDNACVRVWYAQ